MPRLTRVISTLPSPPGWSSQSSIEKRTTVSPKRVIPDTTYRPYHLKRVQANSVFEHVRQRPGAVILPATVVSTDPAFQSFPVEKTDIMRKVFVARARHPASRKDADRLVREVSRRQAPTFDTVAHLSAWQNLTSRGASHGFRFCLIALATYIQQLWTRIGDRRACWTRDTTCV